MNGEKKKVWFSFVLSSQVENVKNENKWEPRSHLCTYEPVFIMHMKNSYLNARKHQGQKRSTEQNVTVNRMPWIPFEQWLRNGTVDSVWWWCEILIRGSDFRFVDVPLSFFLSSVYPFDLSFSRNHSLTDGLQLGYVSKHRVCARYCRKCWKPTIFISANTTHLQDWERCLPSM